MAAASAPSGPVAASPSVVGGGNSSVELRPRAIRKAAIAAMIAIRMMIQSRLPSSDRRLSGTGTALGAGLGVAVGLALGAAAATGVTTIWTPLFGLPLVMTGTPATLRHVWPSSPTSAVTT